jgi:cell wall-associated NlpC family hydrolase
MARAYSGGVTNIWLELMDAVKTIGLPIDDLTVSADLNLDTTSAPTLEITVQDYDRRILSSPLIKRVIQVQLGTEQYWMVAVTKSGDQLTLTFEDSVAQKLKDPRRMSVYAVPRGKVTRAQFVGKLCAAAGVSYYSPEQSVHQRTAGREGKYTFQRGQVGSPETSWDCIQRLASEVHWRAFVRNNQLWFVRDATLAAAPPVLDITETDAGITEIDFNWDTGKAVITSTIEMRLDLLQANLGDHIRLHDMGPGTGDWLVVGISCDDLSTPDGTVSLALPVQATLEPAGSKGRKSGSGSANSSDSFPPIHYTGTFFNSKDMQALHDAIYGTGKKKPAAPSGPIDPMFDQDAQDRASTVMDWAHKWTGTAYAHTNHGLPMYLRKTAIPPFDCSSLVSCAWAQVGIDLSNNGDDTTWGILAKCQAEGWFQGVHGYPADHFQLGDIIFPMAEWNFDASRGRLGPGHVELWDGNGNIFAAHAPGVPTGSAVWGGIAYFWCRPGVMGPGRA